MARSNAIRQPLVMRSVTNTFLSREVLEMNINPTITHAVTPVENVNFDTRGPNYEVYDRAKVYRLLIGVYTVVEVSHVEAWSFRERQRLEMGRVSSLNDLIMLDGIPHKFLVGEEDLSKYPVRRFKL
jgi:hypothetical protein